MCVQMLLVSFNCLMYYSTDINECLTNNGGCDHICINTRGSYQCSCNTSFVLAADNMTCNVESCTGYTTKDLSGSICTNGFPNSSYAPNSNCTWIIDLPKIYNSIELKFDGLSIQRSTDCVKDRVTILNGISDDSLPLGTYCGSQLPATLHSSTGAVTVKFTSDGANNKAGFKLHYRGLEERVAGEIYTVFCLKITIFIVYNHYRIIRLLHSNH